MTLVDRLAIDRGGDRSGNDRAALCAQAHRPAEVGADVALLDATLAVVPLGDQADHRVRRIGVELGAVGAGQAAHVACELDDGQLHAQADAEIRDAVFARVADCLDLALDPAPAETARNQDGVEAFEHRRAFGFDALRIDVVDRDAALGVDSRVHERLAQRLVRLGEVDVLADHRDAHFALRVLEPVHEAIPGAEVGRAGVEPQDLADRAIDALLVQHARDLVDRVGVLHRDDRIELHVGEQRDLRALLVGNAPIGPAHQHVGLDPDLAQFLHGMLRGLGLQFARRRNERHERQVHEAGIAAPQLQAHLPHRLEEGQRFDVAHRTADLDDRHLRRIGRADVRAALDERLDLVGDVRDDLHRAAEILAAALLADHRVVDLAGGEVVRAPHARRDEALVVPEVEIRLGAVFGDEHLPVLERAHRSGVDVDVGIELEQRDAQAAGLEQRADGGGGDALAER